LAKKKLLLLPLIVTLMLLFVVSMITSACSCGVQGGNANKPPVLVRLAVSPDTINPGGVGTLIANATDPDGDLLEYEWSISDGAINKVTGNVMTFTAPNVPSIITIEVTISDQYGGVTTGYIAVTVAEEENANAGAQVIVNLTVSPTTITTGGQGAVTVNVTGYGGNISELEYEWSISDGAINDLNKNETTFTAPDNTGTITIKVKISDQDGDVAQGSIQVTVVQEATQGGAVSKPAQ
jgi:hypothetical protein